jgi:glutaredoxin 3
MKRVSEGEKGGNGPLFRIYTTKTCPYCIAAKNLLTRLSLPYEEIDLTENRPLREEVSRKTGWKTVPMIFFREEFVGGYEELVRFVKDRGFVHR